MPTHYADVLVLKATPLAWGFGPRSCAEPKCAKVLTGKRRKYCSRRCCVAHYQRVIWCPVKRRKRGTIEMLCAERTCGQAFSQPAKQRRKRTYCQKKCKTKASHRRQKAATLANQAMSEVRGIPVALDQVRRVLLPEVPDSDGAEVFQLPLHVLQFDTG